MASQTRGNGEGLPRRPFGRAGDPVSIITLGGWHSVERTALEKADESESIILMHAAIDEGINFFVNEGVYLTCYTQGVSGSTIDSTVNSNHSFIVLNKH